MFLSSVFVEIDATSRLQNLIRGAAMFDTTLMKKVLIHSLFTHYCVEQLLAILNTGHDGAEFILRLGRQRLLQNRFVVLGVCGDARSRLQNVDWMRQCF